MRIFIVFLSLLSLVLGENIEVNVTNNSKNSKMISAKTKDAIIYDYVPQELDLSDENTTQNALENSTQESEKQEEALKGTKNSLKTRITTKIIDSKGSGSDAQEALNNALINALSQLRGVSGENLRKEVKSVKFALTPLGQIEQSSNEFLQNASKGRIDTYKINAINSTQNGVEVEISAYKYIFKGTQKNKLVLLDLSKTDLSEKIKQALNDSFSQSENFTILQRDENYKSENDLLKSEDISSEEVYKLGNVLGADYILEFKILNTQKFESKLNSKDKLSLNIAYKLVFFPTREVLYSRTLNFKLNLSDDIKKKQKDFEKIAFEFRKELEDSLFSGGQNLQGEVQKTAQEKGITYKLGGKGGVDLGF